MISVLFLIVPHPHLTYLLEGTQEVLKPLSLEPTDRSFQETEMNCKKYPLVQAQRAAENFIILTL